MHPLPTEYESHGNVRSDGNLLDCGNYRLKQKHSATAEHCQAQ